MVATAITSGPLLVGPGLLWRIISGLPLDREPEGWFVFLFDRGISPVQNLWTLSFGYDGIPLPQLLAALTGLTCHGLLALGLWRLIQRRFDADKGPPAELQSMPQNSGN
jgi:hypothetical protein